MSASARARASQKYKSRLSLERGGLRATHRYPNVRRRASEAASGTSQSRRLEELSGAANLASTSNTEIPVLMDVTNEQTVANLASTSTTGIPVLMDVTNEQTIDISIGSATGTERS
ncbi:hypothetical protein TNCV_1021791 [Trichonephila clavipes]|nr:hypothetical protein TNCV_1021791 [Trichonephila clavipes]